MESTLKSRIEGLWMIPLGFLSLLFFRAARAIFARLIQRQTFSKPSYVPGWRPISGKALQLKWYLPWMATRGPRWNPHALIVNAGPFKANKLIRVRLADAYDSAQDWTAILYSHPNYKTLCAIGPVASGAAPEWIDIEVEPGEFAVSLRYYRLLPGLRAPAIEIDGQPYCPSAPLPPANNDFYKTLASNSNWFYRAMQYYAFVLMRFERSIDPAVVKREFLPVGNPNTQFVYGYHLPGQRIKVDIAPEIAARCYAYLTVYEMGSFPVAWWDLDAPALLTDVQQRKGFFLLRLCAKPGETVDVSQGITARAVAAS